MRNNVDHHITVHGKVEQISVFSDPIHCETAHAIEASGMSEYTSQAGGASRMYLMDNQDHGDFRSNHLALKDEQFSPGGND